MQLAPGLIGALIGAAAALTGQIIADVYARRRDRSSYLRGAAADYIANIHVLLTLIRTAYADPRGSVDRGPLAALQVPTAGAQIKLSWAVRDFGLPSELFEACESAWSDFVTEWDKRNIEANDTARLVVVDAVNRLRAAVGNATQPRPSLAQRLFAFSRRNLPASTERDAASYV